jgi:hypothetical protein
MGGVCPNASENGQISPSTTVRAARGDGSCPNCASALQGARETANIQAGSGVIWRIPAEKVWHSECEVTSRAYMNVEGDDGLMRTGWTFSIRLRISIQDLFNSMTIRTAMLTLPQDSDLSPPLVITMPAG